LIKDESNQGNPKNKKSNKKIEVEVNKKRN
jgi:hypothetical protein